MNPGLRRAHVALALLAMAGCTQEIVLPISPAAADEPFDASPLRRRDTLAPSPDANEEDPIPDAALPSADAAIPACRALEHPVKQHHPKLIVALDRSASMFRKTGGAAQAPIQWVQDSLRSFMETYTDVIYFGYEEFPISPKAVECGQSCCASKVMPAPVSVADIDGRWSCAGQPAWCKDTFSESPSYDALGRITDYYYGLADDVPGPRYVLLLTDHDPWCPGVTAAKACQRTIEQTSMLRRLFPYVKTLVFGLSDLVSGSLCLSEVAHHGGLARDPNKFPSHYVALNAADFTKQLGEQLALMARDVCTFSVDQYVKSLAVSLDGVPVPHDGMDGWEWVSDYRFQLNGRACDTMLTSTSVAIDVQQCRH